MHITKLKIENFRSIKKLDLEMCGTTVLIGPNNSGKTAILEALRIALTRRWGQRGTGFTEYDVHLPDDLADPRTAGKVIIEVELHEKAENEWPEDLRADLTDIIQIDGASRCGIILRVSCGWDAVTKSYVPTWEFLNVDRRPLAGTAAKATNLQEFFQYLPVFYLDALRDAESEYSSRSQFWGRLLREVHIPENLQKRAQQVFDRLNTRILGADPKLGRIVSNLENINTVVKGDSAAEVELRATPLRPWDLLSKSEVICRSAANKPWFPLIKQGQGTQSLSVMFLFKAFVEELMSELYRAGSTPLLALEEPETHLHPQATRALWKQIADLPGQKVLSSHSPFFLQHVPFRDLRLVRMTPQGTSVKSLPTEYRASLPENPLLTPIIQSNCPLLDFDMTSKQLIVRGKFTTQIYRDVLASFGAHPKRVEATQTLTELRQRSSEFVSDEQLEQLETFARRIRGEIFFARQWFLVEGQSEFLLSHAIAEAIDFGLDQNGISVIDCQNNGSPQIFAVLARALGIPWHAVFDGDDQGKKFVKSIADHDFSADEVNKRCAILSGTLEAHLISDGLQPELITALELLGYERKDMQNDADLLKILSVDSNKISNSRWLVTKIRSEPAFATRLLKPIHDAIEKFKENA
jgi:putative ATP-dependent endonuclease of OLD family